jgi:hypothetical protein
MASKRHIAAHLHVRRGLSESEAAVYVGISPTYFRDLVSKDLMPRPRLIGKRRVYDIVELDIAFSELPRDSQGEGLVPANSWADFA